MAAAVVPSGTLDRRDILFASVFNTKTHTTPTPQATPVIDSSGSPESSFGSSQASNDPIRDAVKLNRAWSAATRFLALSREHTTEPKILEKNLQAERAILFLLNAKSTQKELREWYGHEIGVHFRHFFLPDLSIWQNPIEFDATPNALRTTAQVLQRAQDAYIKPLMPIVRSSPTKPQSRLLSFAQQVKADLHVLVLNSLPQQRIQKTLAYYFFQIMSSSLMKNSNPEKCLRQDRCSCSLGLNERGLSELEDVGLGGPLGERALALATHKLLEGPAIERKCFEVDWMSKTTVVHRLRTWIQDQFTPAIQRALTILTKTSPTESLYAQSASVALANFGRLRAHTLFDYVRTWPDSQGAVLDLKEYLNANSTSEKAFLCSSFSDQTQRRLLHSGASTIEILAIYVNVIHVFKLLDPRGVLLEKVAIPIRNYVRNRDDTVTIIAASFLAETNDRGNVSGNDLDKVCADIAVEVANAAVGAQDYRTSNWDDMEWIPDPIDAGPDHKFSGSEDALSYILGLFEQEEFVKELLPFLGQHFLRTSDLEFTHETRLIELLKSRLDASKLQAAEVMLKDMRDSKQLDRRINPPESRSNATAPPTPREIQASIPPEGITLSALYSMFETRMKRTQFVAAIKLVANRRNDLYFPKRTRVPPERPQPPPPQASDDAELHVKILSGFFWPQLRSNAFEIPTHLARQLARYEAKFLSVSGQRRIQWRPALGTMNVVLELEDRTIEENDVPAWRSSVIDVFASMDDDISQGLGAAYLMEALKMDEELVTDALSFWVGKRVLYQKTPGEYAVLERVDMEIERDHRAVHPQGETISAVKSQDAMFRDSAPMFETFIMNMLRNNGPREIRGMMGITNMLKMVLPTFTYGDEEVALLLSEMEGRKMVSKNGDTWAAAK